MNMKAIGVIMAMVLLAVLIGAVSYVSQKNPDVSPRPATDPGPAPASGSDNWKTHNIGNYSFEYPADFSLETTSATTLRLSRLRPDRVIEPVDCGGFTKAPDEIVISIFVSPNQPSYIGNDYREESIGGKNVKARRNIPGMCQPVDSIIWKASNGSFVEFEISPSNTQLVPEYVRIIETFRAGS